MPFPEDPPGFLPLGGNYKELLSYKKSEVIYDFTFRFCEKFFNRGDRTIDQMVQSARSGKQNIAEGSNLHRDGAEAHRRRPRSLEELLLDYQDYLRIRDHPLWYKKSREALYVRKLGKTKDESYETYRSDMDTRPPEVLANIAIYLIHQAGYLLDQQIKRLPQKRRPPRKHDQGQVGVSENKSIGPHRSPIDHRSHLSCTSIACSPGQGLTYRLPI